MSENVYTIGHSTHSIDIFVGLLLRQRIEVVADVRSAPFSRFNPQFNRDELKASLKEAGIRYVFLGKELGARSNDPACYLNNKVQYDLLAKTDLFNSGLQRVIEGADKYRIAMMCAEKDPLHCHRTILVARALRDKGLEVRHILSTGEVETQEESIDRLMKSFGMSYDDMFSTKDDVVSEAYAKQAEKIAYDQDNDSTDPATREVKLAQSGTVQ